jgi:hypothetical protein
MHQYENRRSKPRAMHTFETMQIRCLCRNRTMHQDLSFGVENLVEQCAVAATCGKRAFKIFSDCLDGAVGRCKRQKSIDKDCILARAILSKG